MKMVQCVLAFTEAFKLVFEVRVVGGFCLFVFADVENED